MFYDYDNDDDDDSSIRLQILKSLPEKHIAPRTICLNINSTFMNYYRNTCVLERYVTGTSVAKCQMLKSKPKWSNNGVKFIMQLNLYILHLCC